MDARKKSAKDAKEISVDLCGFSVYLCDEKNLNHKVRHFNRKDARGNRNERKEIQLIKQE
jgi:hypothetical protein